MNEEIQTVPPLVTSLGDKSLVHEENPKLAIMKTRTLWWDFKNIHLLLLQSLGPRGPQHKCEQWCQPFVDCKEKPKYDTVHGVINTTNEVAPKTKNVNLGNVWTLMEEKEASGKLARDDGIGDEWRGPQKEHVPRPLQENPSPRSPANLLTDSCPQTLRWSFTFYKLVLKLVRDATDTLQVLLQVPQNLQAIVGHVVQDDQDHVLDVETLYHVPPEVGALQGLSNGRQAEELPPSTASQHNSRSMLT